MPSEASDDSGLGGQSKFEIKTIQPAKLLNTDEKPSIEKKKRPTFTMTKKDTKEKRKHRSSKVHPSDDDIIVEIDDH